MHNVILKIFLSLLVDMTYINTNSSSQMPNNLQTEPAQDVRSPATFFPFSSNANMTSMNTLDYRNAANRTTLYQADSSDSYYYPSINTTNGQLTTSSREQDMNNSCPLCGSSNGHFGTINSRYITYNLTPMRGAQASFSFNNSNVFNEPTSLEYMVIREVRIQSELGRVPAAASIGEMLALTRM